MGTAATPNDEAATHADRRLRRYVATMVAVALALAACSNDPSETATPATASSVRSGTTSEPSTATSDEPPATDTTTAGTPVAGSSEAATPISTAAVEPQPYDRRLVLLGEESVLADVLALGVEPIASSATVDRAGFQGIAGYDTSDIDVLPVTTLNIEQLAALDPDVILTYQFVVDAAGEDVLDALADVHVVPDGSSNAEQIRFVGDVLGRGERAEELVAQLDAATQRADAQIADDCTVSVAAIYAGPSIAAFVDGPWVIPSSILSTGCTLDPGPGDAEPDENGRAYLSREQVGMLDAPRMVLMQSPTVEGEQAAIDEITTDPLWQRLPAVQTGDVVTYDRLGYPGIEGRVRFLAEFTATFDAT